MLFKCGMVLQKLNFKLSSFSCGVTSRVSHLKDRLIFAGYGACCWFTSDIYKSLNNCLELQQIFSISNTFVAWNCLLSVVRNALALETFKIGPQNTTNLGEIIKKISMSAQSPALAISLRNTSH